MRMQHDCNGHHSHVALSRRGLLTGASACIGGLALGCGVERAPAQGSRPTGIIDVHHHVSPPEFINALTKYKLGERPMLAWTPARSLEDMDRAGVALSITSITTPGVWFGDNREARDLARACNEYAVGLAQQYPGRFGTFASLPLPDVDGCLTEIEYVFDVLKVDGIGVMTSFGDKWLGDPSFAPVMAELNRRKAIVYTHPTAANCCRNLLPDVHYSVVELTADTTRAIANLIFTGTTTRYPDIRFIFSHAGGTVPFMYQRLTRYPAFDRGAGLGKNIEAKVPGGVLPALRAFYYDTAQASFPEAMEPLTKLVSSSQILFGTDFPFRTAADHVKGLTECGFAPAELTAIHRENTVRLMPQLARRQ
jgi:predicted TIM-barrel fold metal-dependent hydrolase